MLSLLSTLVFLSSATPTPTAPNAGHPPVEKAAALPTASEEIAVRSAEAAERAAASAQSASESMARLTIAFEKLAGSLEAALAAAELPKEEKQKEKKDEKQEVLWSGLVGLSLISLTGNSNSLTTSAMASLRRESERWIFQLKAGGAYGRTRSSDAIDAITGEVVEVDPETIALNASAELRADLRLTSMFSVYLLGGAMTDHVKSIEARPVGEAGMSVIWIERKKGDLSTLRLQTDFAFRGGKELRFQYYPEPQNIEDQVIAAPRFALAFRYAMTEGLIFTEDFEVLPNVVGDSRVLLSSLTKISLKLIKSLSFSTAFLVTHDTAPAEGKEKTDTALTVGLELAF